MHVYFTTWHNNRLHALLLGILWNVTLVLKAKALEVVLGLGHLALALIALLLALEIAAWLRLPYGESRYRGHDVCKILTGRPNWCWLARARERFVIVRAAAPLPFFSLSSLPLPSRFSPLPIPSFRSIGPYSSSSLPSIPFTSYVRVTNVKNHNDHNPPLGVGNGCVQNETSSKECTINLALCNLPTFILPGLDNSQPVTTNDSRSSRVWDW